MTRRTDWGQVAGWYDQLVGESGSEYHREVVLPGVTRLLAPQKGQRALDVACGQGVLCRLLADKGLEVTGVDMGRDLIELAKQRGPASIHYHLADAKELSFLPEGHFDLAACVLAILHPHFRGPKETHWGWDDKDAVQYRRVDRYLMPRKIPIVTHPGQSHDQYTWSFHKPLGDYIKAARNAGLLIDALEEWPSHKKSTSGPRARAENLAREEIPMFLALRAVKA